MWANCGDRGGRASCAQCDHHDACADLFPDLFARLSAERRRERQREEVRPHWAATLFLDVMGEVARRVERNVRTGQEAMAASDPPPRAGDGVLGRQIEAHLEPLLATGNIGIESVARALGVSRQTLYRRLKSEGATFEQVLDGLRRRLALRFIEEQGMAVKEVAWRLGFSDPAAFSRAFKRWTGRSPGATRH